MCRNLLWTSALERCGCGSPPELAGIDTRVCSRAFFFARRIPDYARLVLVGSPELALGGAHLKHHRAAGRSRRGSRPIARSQNGTGAHALTVERSSARQRTPVLGISYTSRHSRFGVGSVAGKDKASDGKVALQVEDTSKAIRDGTLSIHSQQPVASAPTSLPPPKPKAK